MRLAIVACAWLSLYNERNAHSMHTHVNYIHILAINGSNDTHFNWRVSFSVNNRAVITRLGGAVQIKHRGVINRVKIDRCRGRLTKQAQLVSHYKRDHSRSISRPKKVKAQYL